MTTPADEGIAAARRDAHDAALRAQNPFGFYGTLISSCEERLDAERVDAIFMEAARQIVAIAGCTHYEATEWLDSKAGRHLADAVAGRVNVDEELDLTAVPWLPKQLRLAFAKSPKHARRQLENEVTDVTHKIARALDPDFADYKPAGDWLASLTCQGGVIKLTLESGRQFTLKITETT